MNLYDIATIDSMLVVSSIVSEDMVARCEHCKRGHIGIPFNSSIDFRLARLLQDLSKLL